MKPIFNIIVLLFSFSICLSQPTNYITNGDFEMGTMPTQYGDFEGVCDYWEADKGNQGNLHSPDYFVNGSGLTNTGFTRPTDGAYSGNRFVGLGSYEIIEQQYNNTLEPGLQYVVSFYFQLTSEFPSAWNNTGKVKVMFAKNKIKYKSGAVGDECTDDYVTYDESGIFGGNEIKTVAEFEPNINTFPVGAGWYRISFGFRAWEDISTYDYFGIDVEMKNFSPSGSSSSLCQGDYIFIDNVRLERADFCESICAPQLGQITHSTLPNSLWAGLFPFQLLVTNATGIDFVLRDSDGHILYNQYAFDPNGLKDIGFSDYYFAWTGILPDGTYLPQDIYIFNLKLWNCDPANEIFYLGESFFYGDNGMRGAIQGYDIINYQLTDCCVQSLYFQNTTLSGQFRADVHDFIAAGSNVTAPPFGLTVVTSGSNVQFSAGNQIILDPGFIVQQGATYKGLITDCIYGINYRNTEPSRNIEDFHNYSELENLRQKVYPNPADNEISINFDKPLVNDNVLYYLYDNTGKLVLNGSSSINGQSMNIDVSTLTYGLYHLKMTTISGIFSTSFIKN